MKFTRLLVIAITMSWQIRLIAAQPATNSVISSADQIKNLRQQVDDAYAAYTATNDASRKLWEAYYHLNDTNLPQIFELAKKDPASETAFEAFTWIVTNGRIGIHSLRPYGHQSLEFLRDYHTTNPDIGEVCRKLGSLWDPRDQAAIDFLQIASEKNPDRTARGYATFALGQKLKQKAEIMADFPLEPPSTNQWWLQAKADYQEQIKKTDAKTLSAEAEQLFETVLAKYADCPAQSHHGIRQPATLGEKAKVELYELNHLMIGKVAPEISGKDIDGNNLKLSQYRGDVVVLSFWASWCGPCMQMIPLERALTERFKGQPFTILGVNGDENTDDAKRAVQKEQVSWPSFWNQRGPNETIADTWNVHGWPTVYVLDPDRVIRLKFEGYGSIVTSNLLSGTVERLLTEFQHRKK